MLTHPEEGEEVGLLEKILQRLDKLGLILYGKREKSTYNDSILSQKSKLAINSQLDHFEKWLGILKLEKSDDIIGDKCGSEKMKPTDCENDEPSLKRIKLMQDISASEQSACTTQQSPLGNYSPCKKWKARRVDLIIAPYSQFYFALVGWTGSKLFNRDLRLYATRTQESSLTSHGLYSHKHVSTVFMFLVNFVLHYLSECEG